MFVAGLTDRSWLEFGGQDAALVAAFAAMAVELGTFHRHAAGLAAAPGAFTDFLTSLYHTERGGRRRNPAQPLPPAFKHLPIAYNSRASSVRVSGEPITEPKLNH